ncbi:related to HCM1-Forkhead transcription factor [Sporisorium scitamineum]|uniref:Related to HCM1-Forkhead transcription factor n=1 Tax=Sporisorium scitamineum TaxID=49012 RepID=A0A127Z4G4_9BASI|nr:related to HCM1-Forkhead transcription factor [Sporisorium scitamineum]
MSAGCSRGPFLLRPVDALASTPFDSRNGIVDDTLSPLASLPLHRDQFQTFPSTSRPVPSPEASRYDHHHTTATFLHSKPPAERHAFEANCNTDKFWESRTFRSKHYQTVWDNLDAGNADRRPDYHYIELIKLCILKRREGKLTLNELYHDLEEKFPFFANRAKGKGWKNTIRHNLSCQPYFIKMDRQHGQMTKGHYWAYDPQFEKPTSLAQSSIVQLSSLWPTSSRARAGTLPRFDDCWVTEKHDVPRSYGASLRNEAHPYVSPIAMLRRRSSPVRRPLQYDADQPVATRMRSATVSTISSSSGPNLRCCEHSFGFAHEGGSSTSVMSVSDADRDSVISSVGGGGCSEEATRLLRLPGLPPLLATSKRKSLGDWYLSHPISRW